MKALTVLLLGTHVQRSARWSTEDSGRLGVQDHWDMDLPHTECVACVRCCSIRCVIFKHEKKYSDCHLERELRLRWAISIKLPPSEQKSQSRASVHPSSSSASEHSCFVKLHTVPVWTLDTCHSSPSFIPPMSSAANCSLSLADLTF